MADFNSKYTGEQVEALLDIVSQGGGSGGGGGTITEAEITAMGFTKNQGTITEVKMNGVSKGTSGVVDLGDVPTKDVVDGLLDWQNGADGDIANLYSDKQDVITDLATIRDGANKGATAVQPKDISEFITVEDVATVATTGSYNDLVDKPTIPSAVTESTVSGWGFTKNTGTYSKPSGGIPRSDLASDVYAAIMKAEQYTGTVTGIKLNGETLGANAGVVDLGVLLQGEISGNTTAVNIQGFINDNLYVLPNAANGDEDDILLSRDTVKTINGESIFGSGDITIEGSGGAGGGKEVIIYEGAIVEQAEADKIYIMQSSVRRIGVYDLIIPNNGVYGEYVFIFDTSESEIEVARLEIPDYVIWANGTVPTLEAGVYYELSIVYTNSSVGGDIFKAVLTPFKPV